MRALITTRCEATLTETWSFEVPDDWTDEQITEAFDSGEEGEPQFLSESADNEQNRRVVGIER